MTYEDHKNGKTYLIFPDYENFPLSFQMIQNTYKKILKRENQSKIIIM